MSTFELHAISLFFACQVNFCFEEEESSAMDIHTLWSFFNNKNQLNKLHVVESVYVKICKADLHVQSWFQIWTYEYHILEVWDEELNVKKIIADITYLHKEGLKKIFSSCS